MFVRLSVINTTWHFRTYPAHLHIDLVARAQGTGNGAQMMAVLLADLKSRGIRGVHLGMSSSNDRAFKFYLKVPCCRNACILMFHVMVHRWALCSCPVRRGRVSGFWARCSDVPQTANNPLLEALFLFVVVACRGSWPCAAR